MWKICKKNNLDETIQTSIKCKKIYEWWSDILKRNAFLLKNSIFDKMWRVCKKKKNFK